MFGQTKPIICNEDGVVLVGNGLLDALIRMGAETADCYVMAGLSEKEQMKLMMADNKVYDLGSTDVDVFDAFVSELQGDIDVPGWDEELLQLLQSTPTEATKAVSSYGAYTEEQISHLSEKKIEHEFVTAEQTGGASPYANVAPVTKSATVAPVAVVEEEVMATGKYVICPKCGEKIWL
ncbi:MAG: hypothetical protein MJY95_08365 [Bacteroidaceae bacterium]|nr:hypothetical protein [Bacteroidaceae bacterium]